MADIQLTIGTVTKSFDLAVQEKQKLVSVREEPIMPIRALANVPSYGDLPPEKILALVQNNWRGGMGQKDHFNIADMYADGRSIDTREPNQIFLGPRINTIGDINDTILGFEFWENREWAYSATKVYRLSEDNTTWEEMFDTHSDLWEARRVFLAGESLWAPETGVTCTLDGADKMLGDYSVKLEIDDSEVSGLLASHIIDAEDMRFKLEIMVWMKSSIDTADGDLWFMLSNETDGSNPTEGISIPALVANTWTEVALPLGFPALDTGIQNVSILLHNHIGDFTLRFDALRFPLEEIECMSQYDGRLLVGLTTEPLYYGKYINPASPHSQVRGEFEWGQTFGDGIAHCIVVSPPFEGTKDVLVIARRPNEVRTTISPYPEYPGDQEDVDWCDPPYYIGDTNYPITSLFVLGGALFIGREDGVYVLSVDGRPTALIPEFREKRNTTNFKFHTNWQGIFYGSAAGDIMEIVGSSSSLFSLDYMGPLENSPELAMTGTIKGIARDDKNLYAAFLVGSDYIIYTGRERRDDTYGLRWEWVPHIFLGTDVCTAIKVMQRDGENPKLWFTRGAAVNNVILSRSPNFPLGDSNYRFCPHGYLITTYFEAGYDTWSKILYQLWTIASNLTVAVNVKIYYQADTDFDWTLLATVTSNGVQPVDLTAISCKKIRLMVELNSDDSTKTPILSEFILRGVLQPELTKTLDFIVVLSQSDSRKPSTDLAFLESGRVATAPITLKDLRFGTTRYVTFLPSSPMESEVLDEVSKQPSYRARILAQQLNWKPT